MFQISAFFMFFLQNAFTHHPHYRQAERVIINCFNLSPEAYNFCFLVCFLFLNVAS